MLIEEGLKEQRLKRKKDEEEENEKKRKLQTSKSEEALQPDYYHQALFHHQQQFICYPCVKGGSSFTIQTHPSFGNFLHQLKVSQTTISRYNTPWKLHHHNYLGAIPFFFDRYYVKQSFSEKAIHISYHPNQGFLIAFATKLIYFNLQKESFLTIPITNVKSTNWNDSMPNLNIFAISQETSILFCRLLPDRYPHYEPIGHFFVKDGMITWLTETTALILSDSIIFARMVDDLFVIEKKFTKPRHLSISVAQRFHPTNLTPSSPHIETPPENTESRISLLVGLRTGAIGIYEIITKVFTPLYSMPARISLLYQLEGYHHNHHPPNRCYLAKDITGKIVLFALSTEQENDSTTVTAVRSIREGNPISLDLSGIWISAREEMLVTTSMMTAPFPHPPADLTRLTKSSLKDLAVYSLRHDYCCLHESILPSSISLIPSSSTDPPVSSFYSNDSFSSSSSLPYRKVLIPFYQQSNSPFACVSNSQSSSHFILASPPSNS